MQVRSKILSSFAALAVVTGLAGRAQASQEFPAAIQAAAGMPCTPSCVLCHGVDPGTANTFMDKTLGAELFSKNGITVGPHDAGALTTAYNNYAAKPANAANVALLKQGIDPETGANLCSGGVTYGCGAHIAKDTPRDDWSGLLFVAGAMVFGAILRRGKSRSAAG